MIHSFLLIGQSNMAGRGLLSEAPAVDPKLVLLRNGRWRQSFRPVNPDVNTAGYSLAESFAALYAKDHPEAYVGLIPCAEGGTTLDQWQEGSLLFDNAVMQARLAQRTSTVVGILWHQGESDCSRALAPLYKEKLTKIIAALRRETGLSDVPFIAGGLGNFLPEYEFTDDPTAHLCINAALRGMEKELPLFGYADSEGLTHKGDFLHFDTDSLVEFGRRYYRVFEALEKKDRVFAEKPSSELCVRAKTEKI